MPALLIIVPLIALLALNLPFNRQVMNRLALYFGLVWCVWQGLAAVCPQCLTAGSSMDWLFGILAWKPAVDSLSRVALLAISLAAMAAFFAARYNSKNEDRLFLFCNLLLAAMAGMNGVALSGDLFSLYVFLEITAVSSFVLIAFERDKAALEGAFKYFLLSALASALLLGAISLFLVFGGGVSFGEVTLGFRANSGRPLMLLAAAMLLGGLFIKGGLVPFHGWVPDAYSSAPSPAAVLLAGIITKAGGVYALLRVVPAVLGFHPHALSSLLSFGILSVILGALLALKQSDMRRMLAYSSISQVGYIVLGLGAGSPLGLAGAALHFFNHSIFKTLLFVNAAAVEKETGLRDMDRMGGLSNKMPLTGITSAIAFLSTAGIPPLSGFWSKLVIIVALWQAGHISMAVIAVLGSLITLAYFLSLQRRVFFGKLADGFENLKEANVWALLPMLLLAALTVGLGLCMPWLFESFLLPVRSFL